MEILVSYFTTKFDLMKEHWAKHSALKDKEVMGTNKAFDQDLGGLVRRIDWSTKKVIRDYDIKVPTGITKGFGKTFIVSEENKILVFANDFELEGIITSPLLNCTHSISVTDKGLLCASTGLDALVELDLNSNILFEWFATENGYDTAPQGVKREIDKKKDHRNVTYTTLEQTTHVNSAIKVGDYLLATFFHQGYLVKINTWDSSHEVVLQGLKNPHSIYPYKEGFMLSDTSHNQVCILDKNYKIIIEVRNQFNWVQDAVPFGNNFLIADSNNHRIVEINEAGKILDEYRFSEKLKIYQILAV